METLRIKLKVKISYKVNLARSENIEWGMWRHFQWKIGKCELWILIGFVKKMSLNANVFLGERKTLSLEANALISCHLLGSSIQIPGNIHFMPLKTHPNPSQPFFFYCWMSITMSYKLWKIYDLFNIDFKKCF